MDAPRQASLVRRIAERLADRLAWPTREDLVGWAPSLVGAAIRQIPLPLAITTAGLESPEPQVLFVNQAFRERLGGDDDLVGVTLWFLLASTATTDERGALRDAMSRGEPASVGVHARGPGGTARAVRWTLAPLLDDEGRRAGWIVREELSDADLGRRVESLESLLVELLGLTGVVSESLDPALGTQAASLALRAHELVRSLAQSRGLRPTPPDLDLNRCILDAAHLVSAALPTGTDVSWDLGDTIPPVALERGTIQGLLVAAASELGPLLEGPHGRVHLQTRCERLDERALLELLFPRAARPGTFAAISFELVPARAPSPRAFLTARGLARACGGGLRVRDRHAVVVDVLLPVSRVHLQPVPRAAPVRERTVLVLDADPGVRALTRRLLEWAGYLAAEAEDLDAARFVLGAGSIAAAVVDPQGFGAPDAVLATLRATQPRLPVLLVGSPGLFGLLPDARAGGATAVLPKPFRPSELSEILQDVVLG